MQSCVPLDLMARHQSQCELRRGTISQQNGIGRGGWALKKADSS